MATVSVPATAVGALVRLTHAYSKCKAALVESDTLSYVEGEKPALSGDAYAVLAAVCAKDLVPAKTAVDAVRGYVARLESGTLSDAAALNAELQACVFVLGNKLSLADLAVFVALAPIAARWSDEERSAPAHINVVRYLLYLQHVLGVSVADVKYKVASSSAATPAVAAAAPAAASSAPAAASTVAGKGAGKKGAAPAAGAAAAAAPAAEETAASPEAQLDLRVGRIVSAAKHENATSLFVEQIDLGEPTPRTVVSGLVGKVPLESLPNKMVVCLCNLKPVAMRGVKSFAMVLAATSADGTTTELVEPPAGAAPGDRVEISGVAPKPVAELSAKAKVWENVQPTLRTNDAKVALAGDRPLVVAGKGPCTVPTVVGGGIK